jgi:protoporphyrinogen oxidase
LHFRQTDLLLEGVGVIREGTGNTIVIGGGPAGLTAAYELLRHGHKPLVFEKASIVGGIACTQQYKGFHFDMGGHRFFTKSEEVNKMWQEVMGDEFLTRPRLSRIFYNGTFFDYPLKPLNALMGLGPVESVRIFASYVRWKLFPHKVEETFEQWVVNRFGDRLFRTFFKTYTEKVWGISTSELKAEWAAQRIKDLSLKTAITSMFLKPRHGQIKTLIDRFEYPRQGPGQLWEKVRQGIDQRGGSVQMQTECVAVHRQGRKVTGVTVRGADGQARTLPADQVITSMPLTELINKLDPPAPEQVLESNKHLKYRDFLTVCLIVKGKDLFPDNWIYVHEKSVRVGRIQNFGNWSPDMIPPERRDECSSLGLEYFCTEGDDLWTMSDADLIELGRNELGRLGLCPCDLVEDGAVFRVPKSYPVYDSEYRQHLEVLADYIDSFVNLKTIGRNGLHRYNNQDHSMLTGMYAVRTLLHGERHDLWKVNADKEYHEEVREPSADAGVDEDREVEEAVELIFAKVHRLAMGLSVGMIAGAGLMLLTFILALQEGAGPARLASTVELLAQVFPGYQLSIPGSLLGGLYGFATGFLLGWCAAGARNVAMFLTWVFIRRRVERRYLRNLLEFV